MDSCNISEKISECLRFTGFNKLKKKFILTMKIIHDKLLFEGYSENDTPYKYYKIEKTYEELIKNKFLAIYENIDEIYTALYNFILDKEFCQEFSEIIEEEKSILVSIPLNLGKYKEFKISLDESIITPELKILKLEEELKANKNELNKLKEKIFDLEKENIILKEKINKFENERNEKEEYFFKNLFYDSLIIKPEETKILYDWICPSPNARVHFELLYRATRDGDTSESFFTHCSGRGPTVMFEKIDNGHRFGAFTMIPWIKEDKWIADPKAFMFSLTNKMKFELKKADDPHAVRHDNEGYCVRYGDGCTIFVSTNILQTNSNCGCHADDYCTYKITNKQLNGYDTPNRVQFIVKEFEIYAVHFD